MLPPARETLGVPTLAVRDAQTPHLLQEIAKYQVMHVAAHEGVVVAVVDGSSASAMDCRACHGRNGTLEKCNTCPAAFHPACLLDGGMLWATRDPSAPWTCPRCLAFRGEGLTPPAEASGAFKSLIDLIDFDYPQAYTPSLRLTLVGEETQVCSAIFLIYFSALIGENS